MAMIEKNLQELGLSYREARVYKAALELGRFAVSEIADKSGIKRPTCYVILTELVNRGLVSYNPQFKKLPYTVEPPAGFIKQIEGKAQLAKSISADLEGLYASATEKPLMKFYVGQAGMRRVLEDVLKSGVDDIYSVLALENYVRAVGEDYFSEWANRRIEKGITVHTIRTMRENDDRKAIPTGPEYLREFRYAPTSIQIPYTVIIYGKRVALISTSKDGFGLIIESKDFHQTIKGFFDALWMVSQ